ncbi:hypothetical protein BV898_15301 [Hypsibius exemplaris]|uniref:EGF-like domain-containing protein n=1 Tax=Hypsibius exemplaris TaxID=2072580 RepID=A0A9X6RK81_HYPEX|nr:hypothetical protein BV898_15301 [Hypsibius exemplaris]
MGVLEVYFFLLAGVVIGVRGHVRLLYPDARAYALDAIGSRYPGMCGMPRDFNRPTNIQAGSTFNVTWNVGSAHEGGWRVELLDTNYHLLSLLVPQGGAKNDWYGTNPVASTQAVTLPKGLTCQNCVLRLLKLGGMASPDRPAPTYYFNTCSDINVIDEDVPKKCSGNGKWTGTACECRKPFVGDICQFSDECAEDADCGRHGTCVDTQAISYPKKQCYCSLGWHGIGCAMESPVKTLDFKPEDFHQLSAKFAKFNFYWRILKDLGEIEVVIVAKSTNWLALGWRSSALNSSCKAFPDIARETVVTAAADGQPVETVVDFLDRNHPYFTGPLHPMACTDITYIAARGKLSRIRDSYTRDHSTPREDSVFGGQCNLVAAIASEDPETNMVTALFRKKLIASEPSDQSITDGTMHVIWALGQEPFDPTGKTLNQVDKKEMVKQFYRKGELNSHGHDPKSRGVWEVNLQTGATA